MSAYKIHALNNVSKFILFYNKHTNNCEFEQRHHTSVVMWLGGHLERIAGIKKIKHFNVIRVKINNIHLNPPLFFQPMSLYGEDISHWGKYKIYGDGKWCSEWQSLSQDTKMFSLSIQPYHAVSRYLQCQFTSSILCALISLSLSLVSKKKRR